MAQAIDVTTREEIKQVPEIEFTDTWTPWHHNVVLENIDRSLDSKGIEIVSENHDLSSDGRDLFSSLVLDVNGQSKHNLPESMKLNLMLGWRNSMKKRFSLGFVGGVSVYVCSNMGFWGDYKEVRRHDSRLDLENLRIFIDNTISMVVDERMMYLDWFSDLTDHTFDKTDVKILTYESMEQGVLPPSSFNKFTDALIEEVDTQKEFGSVLTAAHFHGGMTRALRGTGMNKLMERTRKLNDLVADYVGIPLDSAKVTKPATLSDLMI